jgi:hypothetical protein
MVVLERAGLVIKRPNGREQFGRANINTVQTAAELLNTYEAVWRSRVDRMTQLLNDETQKGSSR